MDSSVGVIQRGTERAPQHSASRQTALVSPASIRSVADLHGWQAGQPATPSTRTTGAPDDGEWGRSLSQLELARNISASQSAGTLFSTAAPTLNVLEGARDAAPLSSGTREPRRQLSHDSIASVSVGSLSTLSSEQADALSVVNPRTARSRLRRVAIVSQGDIFPYRDIELVATAELPIEAVERITIRSGTPASLMSADLIVGSLLLAGAGGAVGSIVRTSLALYIPLWGCGADSCAVTNFPSATFIVNVIGCCILGIIAHLSITFCWNPLISAAFSAGFCGGLTTLSTFVVETIRLVEAGNWATALVYFFSTQAATFASGIAGWLLAGIAKSTNRCNTE